MSLPRFTPEFKDEAVRQITERGHSVVDVHKRVCIADGVLCTWVIKFDKADEPIPSGFKALQA